MAVLQLNVLGYPQVSVDGQVIEGFLSNKVLVLLCYLALNPRPHAREHLATLLWGDMPDTKAKSNLRQALHDLSKRLGDTFIVTRQTAQLNPDCPVQIDAVQLENLLNTSAIDALQDFVNQHDGLFLEGINLNIEGELDDWLRTTRETYRLRYLDALEHLIEQWMASAEWRMAHGLLHQSLRIEPLRETTHRHLMLCLARQGRYTEALHQFEQCQVILNDELGIMPSEETLALYRQLQRARNHPPMPPRPYAFVGRQRDIATLQTWLDEAVPRLVTILGEGGIGKTRLAQQVMQTATHRFLDGVAFVPLEGFGDVAVGIAETLIQAGYLPKPNNITSVEGYLLQHICDREMLLVLDNFEHLIDQYTVVAKLLESAPDLKIMITSRRALNIRWEQILRLEGLPYPTSDNTEHWRTYDAITLFMQTAQRLQHSFALVAAEEPHVIEICSLVQGLPLAIELAAAQTRKTTCANIATQIKTTVDSLVTALRDMPPRQVSMRATFDYSWQMLSSAEQGVLQQLAVFVGNTSRQAIQSVTHASDAILDSLVNQSLLRQTDVDWFSMHELLRQYVLEKLDAPDTIQQQHTAYYLGTLAQQQNLIHQQPEPIRHLTLEMDNIRAAWQYGIQHLDHFASPLLNSLHTLREIYDRNGWSLAGLDWIDNASQNTDTVLYAQLAAHLQLTKAFFLYRLGKLNESLELALQIADATDFVLEVEALGIAFKNWYRLRRSNEASPYINRILPRLNTLDDVRLQSSVLVDIGLIHFLNGEIETAEQVQQRALDLAQHVALKTYQANAIGNLGITIGFRDPHRAAEHFRAAIQINEDMDNLAGLVAGYHNLAIYGRVTKNRALQESCLQRCVEIQQILQDESGIALLDYELAAAYYEWGELENAKQHFHKGLAYYQSVQSGVRCTIGLTRLGHITRQLDEPKTAFHYYRQAIEQALNLDDESLLIEIVVGVAALESDPIVAAEWLGAALSRLEAIPPLDHITPYIDPLRQKLAASLSENQFKTALDYGRNHSIRGILQKLL